MARIHPGCPEHLLSDDAHRGEVLTLRQLEAGLPDDYTVYHSVHFAHLEGRTQRFGEVDFVVVNASGDVLLIEQKNGAISEADGELRKDYSDGPKDITTQVQRARDTVFSQLTDLFGAAPPVTVIVLLYCPDHELQGAGSAGLPREAIVDASQRSGLEAWIERHLGPGRPDRADIARSVRDWAGRVLHLAPDLAAGIDRQEATYSQLAGGLTELVEGFHMEPWRLRIQASAGSGKSLAAQHAFLRAREQGRRPLLLCFNNVLSHTLQASLGETRDVGTFHNWCRQMLEANGRAFDIARAGDPAYWVEIVHEVCDCEPPEPRYDTFIIDEAQDFDPEWWALLQCFGADDPDTRILCFEDDQQDLYGRAGPPIEQCVGYRTRAVYRTPQRIARFIERALKPGMDWRSPFDGFTPEVHPWENADEQIALAATRIDAMLARGFRPEQILLLSMRGRSNALFERLECVGEHRLCKFTGEFEDTGKPKFTAGTINAETLMRFKGNQSPAVIVLDFDPDGADEALDRRKAYCALTRATVACDVLVAAGSGWRGRLERAV